MPGLATEAMKQTHQPRPQPKRMLPLRIVSFMMGGKPLQAIEYDTIVPILNGGGGGKKTQVVTRQTHIEVPQEGCCYNPFNYYVLQLMQAFWEEEARIDGLLASIDQLTTQNVSQSGEIGSLEAKLAESKRQLAEAKEQLGQRITNGNSKGKQHA